MHKEWTSRIVRANGKMGWNLQKRREYLTKSYALRRLGGMVGFAAMHDMLFNLCQRMRDVVWQ